MTKTLDRLVILAGMCLSLGITPALAQQTTTPPETAGEDPILRADEVVVQGSIGYRNRTDETVQTLEYGQDYFQRFEPLTAGDALKRVPSVTFLSDVIESDGARLRGLDPGYTQILIDGEKVPGSNADRSFFLDRVPAELIDRVEIVRSSSARRSGDAVAGTLNIVLRDAYELDGGYVRIGALRFDDGEFKESLGAVYGGEVGGGRLLIGGNLQGRYNPKIKKSLRYGDSPENNPAFRTEEFDDREYQTDTRDGTDYSLNGSYILDLSQDLELSADGVYVKTERTETERSLEYEDPTAIDGPLSGGGSLASDEAEFEDIEQDSYSFRVKLENDGPFGKTKAKLSFSSFEESNASLAEEVGFDEEDPAEWEGELEQTDITDEEFGLELAHRFDVDRDTGFEVGLFWQSKERDTSILAADDDYEFADGFASYDQFSDKPQDFRIELGELEPVDGGLSVIEEDRFDVFGLLEGEKGGVAWEVGLRYESTEVTIEDGTVSGSLATTSQEFDFLLPSASARIDLTEVDRVTLSGARTVRRPRFDFITPVYLEEEFGDEDFLGNPNLRPEVSIGFDLGYERRIGRSGIFGVNVFYRDIEDLVELQATGQRREDDGDFFEIFQPRNTGDGTVYGIEFDLSTPLSMFGLDDTGVFANYSLLESEIEDVLGERTFNGQSDYVYNFGFIQDLPAQQVAFGATYRKQGDALDRFVSEEVTTSYGADLEVFVEKSFGERFTIRAVGQNLLNASKDEVFNKFDTLQDQIDRDFDEYELETEEAGPVFQIVARLAF